MSRRLAATSLALCFLFAALPARTARRPRYGGTLRLELGAIVSSLDPIAAPVSAEESPAKFQIDSLIYEGLSADGTFTGDPGSGPFKISSWQPGKQLNLQANEKFREGRPFVDAIDVAMGRQSRDRVLDLELNKTDLIQIPPQDARHAAERGFRVSQSQPDELLAVVFLGTRAGANADRARQTLGAALSLSIDRSAIVTFLLQKVGEPTGALLPQWSSGTSFLFSTSADLSRAKELWSQITPSPKFALGYDSADPLEQSVAERIVVNAKETGISMTAVGLPQAAPAQKTVSNSAPVRSTAKPDALLVRVPMTSPKPAAALNDLLRTFNSVAGGDINASPFHDSSSPEEIYKREREIVNTYRVVPLVWLPQVYGLNARVRNWIPPAPGQTWPLADVWLDSDAQGAELQK